MAKKKKPAAENSPKNTTPDRLKPHCWKPGQSGNPGGRPENAVSASAVARAILAAKCEIKDSNGKLRYEGKTKLEALFERIYEIALAKNDMRAARLLLEYGYGKPLQQIGGEGGQPIEIRIVEVAPDGEE